MGRLFRAWMLFALATAVATPASSQTLHLISIAASDDATIGTGTAANAKAITDYAKTVANFASLTLAITDIRGAKFTCDAINGAVEKLKVAADDVVLFHYSGHGFVPSEEPVMAAPDGDKGFPWLYCDAPGARPNLFGVFETLLTKGARLTIVGADACNVVVPGVKLMEKGIPLKDAIRAMYRDFKGGIAYSSSKRGQFSWYYPSGGIYTGQLLRSLQAPPSVSNARDLWESALAQASKSIKVNAGSGPVEQTPIYDTRGLQYLR